MPQGAACQFFNPASALMPRQAPIKTITFAGGAGTGAFGTAVPLYTVSGDVLITRIMAKCTTGLAGATATISVGTAGVVAGLIAVTTATGLTTTNKWWTDATPAPMKSLAALNKDAVLSDNIIINPLVAGVTGGVLVFYCEYIPLSAGASLS